MGRDGTDSPNEEGPAQSSENTHATFIINIIVMFMIGHSFLPALAPSNVVYRTMPCMVRRSDRLSIGDPQGLRATPTSAGRMTL